MDVWNSIIIFLTIVNVACVCIQRYYLKKTMANRDECIVMMEESNSLNTHTTTVIEDMRTDLEDMRTDLEDMRPKAPHMPTQEETEQALNERDEG